MATLTTDKPRIYGPVSPNDRLELPVKASTKIQQGSAVGDASGLARKLVAGDAFMGFAEQVADNSSGADSAIRVTVIARGVLKRISITGVASVDDHGATVYMSDDDVFTLTSSGNTAVGKIIQYRTDGTCDILFEAACLRSI